MSGPSVLFLTADWLRGARELGSISYQRIGLPATKMMENGWDVLVTPNFSVHESGRIAGRTWDGGRQDGYDVVVLHRSMQDIHVGLVEQARAAGQVVVSEVDDWYWGIPSYNVAFWGTHKSRDAHVNRDWYLEVLRASTAVITSTPYLKERLEGLGVTDVYVCSNHVDVGRFADTFNANVKGSKVAGRQPTVGWVGATPWRGSDLTSLRGVIGPFLERHDVDFLHAGWSEDHRPIWEDLGIDPSDRLWFKAVCHPEVYPQMLEGIHIGLVPLTDNPFNQAKSCLKGLEYAAAGVPFVAFPSSEYQMLAAEGIGRLASKPKQWVKQMEALLDPGVRVDELVRQRDMVRKFDVSHGWKQWADVLQQLTYSTVV